MLSSAKEESHMNVVKITASEYTTSQQEGDPTKGLSIRLSPLDIPLEIKGSLLNDGVFHIDFVYPDKEESTSRVFNEQVSVKIGKHSGKILGLEIKFLKHDIKEMLLTLDAAVKKELPRLAKYNERENYRLINRLVQAHREPLFKGFPTEAHAS